MNPSHAPSMSSIAWALGIGLLLALVLTAANLYLGLCAGMTVSASIPASVLGLALYRALRRSDIHGVNLVQTLASSGESLAAGALFTVPSMVLAGAWTRFPFWPSFLMAMSGSLLGIVLMVPLRKKLMEDSRLRFPEGVACAAVLQAGHSQVTSTTSSSLRDLFWGMASGAGFKVMTGMAWLLGTVEGAWRAGRGVLYLGADASPALLAVGYLTGPGVALQVFAGGILAWGLLPWFGLSPGGMAPLDTAWSTWSQSLRYFGAGTMVVAGLWSLVQALPMVWEVLRGGGRTQEPGKLAGGGTLDEEGTLPGGRQTPGSPGPAGSGQPSGGRQLAEGLQIPGSAQSVEGEELLGGGMSDEGGRTVGTGKPPGGRQTPGSPGPAGSSPQVTELQRGKGEDIQGPLWWGLLALALACVFGLYTSLLDGIGLAVLATALVAIASFVWVAVSSHIVGLVGSSNNPVSGMTLSALLGTALILLLAGFHGSVGVTATLGIAAVVCCAACSAADCSQDLKTGYILGTSPWWQQLFEVVGAVLPALLVAPVLNLLHQAYGIGTGLKAPQATLFAHLAQGVFGQGDLPIGWLATGLAFGGLLVATSIILKTKGAKAFLSRAFPKGNDLVIHPMAVAVGMYLPFSLSVPMAIGGWVHAHMVKRSGPSGAESGTLFASGLVAGEALTGVALALLVFFKVATPSSPWAGMAWVGPILTLTALGMVAKALSSRGPS